MPAVTRAAAAAQHQEQHPPDPSQGVALELALATAGHLLDQRDVCALLCTSEATAACVGRSCSGSVAVRAKPKTLQRAQELAHWLGKHSSLPRSLDVGPALSEDERADHEAADTALLGVLPSLTGLRGLSFWPLWTDADTSNPAAHTAALAAAIQPLTRLTEFRSDAVYDADDMRLFPASLQQISVGFCGWWERDSPRKILQLGHLTAVTDLDLGALNEDELFAGPDGDVLPPNLVRLRGTFSGVEVLKGLPSLRHLDGLYSSASIAAFAAAGLAAQLTHVGLQHSHMEDEDEEELVIDEHGDLVMVWDASFGLADAVKRLQEAGAADIVRDVELDNLDQQSDIVLSPAVVAELHRLPNLQSLRLVKLPFDVPSTKRLGDLTQLTSLDLANIFFTAAEYRVLLGVLARLPSLRDVSFVQPNGCPGIKVPAAVCTAFAKDMARLTHLSISTCSWL